MANRGLYEKLIEDADRLEWFLREVVSEEWHAQHDAGVPFAQMIAELSAQYPQERELIELYAPRWLECVPGPIDGTHDIVRALDARGCRSIRLPISAWMHGRCSGRRSRCLTISAISWCRGMNA
jgi:hypothetical protein